MNQRATTEPGDERRAEIAREAGAMLNQGYHCSEAVLLAAAPPLVADWEARCARLATPFAGGTGGTQQELCGALSGGMMVIGALLGRETADVNDDEAQRLAAAYRGWFLETLGDTQCETLRRGTVKGPGGLGSCSVLVERATALLLEMLDEAGYALTQG
jgi:C_GCAxxG_C_C family probable redox protein